LKHAAVRAWHCGGRCGLGGGVTARGAVRVDNLADRRHVASAFLNPDVVAGEPVAFEPGLPRQVVVSVSRGRGGRGRSGCGVGTSDLSI
jgi:hypothetical protein